MNSNESRDVSQQQRTAHKEKRKKARGLLYFITNRVMISWFVMCSDSNADHTHEAVASVCLLPLLPLNSLLWFIMQTSRCTFDGSWLGNSKPLFTFTDKSRRSSLHTTKVFCAKQFYICYIDSNQLHNRCCENVLPTVKSIHNSEAEFIFLALNEHVMSLAWRDTWLCLQTFNWNEFFISTISRTASGKVRWEICYSWNYPQTKGKSWWINEDNWVS